MPTFSKLRLALGLVALIALGCTPERKYNVQVLNQTNGPITVGLAKEGKPYEPHLAGPEEAAINSGAAENAWPCTIVEPNKIGSTRVKGKFAGDTPLMLRVYGGERSLSEVIAMGHGSPDRADLFLHAEPAMNKVIVRRSAGRLQAERVEQLPRSTSEPARAIPAR